VLGIGYDYDYYSLATARYRINFADSFAQAKALLLINVKCFGEDYVQKVNKAVVNMFEAAYPNDDMSYESLGQLCTLHRYIAEDEPLPKMVDKIGDILTNLPRTRVVVPNPTNKVFIIGRRILNYCGGF